MSSWLVLGIARASITVRTSDNGYATGSAPDLAADFPAADLAWFMETTKEALFGPEADRAAAVLEWIRALPTKDRWGTQQIKDLVAASLPADVTSLDIFICSQDPELLAFPWELVAFPAPFSHLVLGVAGRIERVETRQLLEPETLSISSTTPIDRITAMLVSPRPELQGDVPFSPTVGAALVAASRFPESSRLIWFVRRRLTPCDAISMRTIPLMLCTSMGTAAQEQPVGDSFSRETRLTKRFRSAAKS